MHVLCKTPGKKRAFSVQRNLLHEQNDVVTILKGFMDFWHGIWMYVAFSTDFVLDSKKNVVDGKMTGTVLNDDVGQATKAAEATQLFVEGKDVEEYYWVDYVKVTAENAAQYL